MFSNSFRGQETKSLVCNGYIGTLLKSYDSTVKPKPNVRRFAEAPTFSKKYSFNVQQFQNYIRNDANSQKCNEKKFRTF